jgi:hypothetical protein
VLINYKECSGKLLLWQSGNIFNMGKKTTRSNREEYVEIMEHIHEILCIIVQLNSTLEIKGVLPMAVFYDIAKFTEQVSLYDNMAFI